MKVIETDGINLHVYPSTFRYESRILKETRALGAAGFFDRIVIAALWEDGLPDREQIDDDREVVRVRGSAARGGGVLGKLIRHFLWTVRVFQTFRHRNLVAVNCHSLSVLPLCVLLKKLSGARLVYDTHELETETVGSTGLRRLAARMLETCLIRWVDHVIVVSESIADWYRNAYGLPVSVVRNLPDIAGQRTLGPVPLKETLGLAAADVLFLYHGLLSRGRGIDLLLRVFKRANPDRHIAFMGYGELYGVVVDAARGCPRIHMVPVVRPDEILSHAQGADVGLCLIEPLCLSYRYCLPNKLFESIAAGVPVAVSDLPDMARVIDEHECGWKVPLNEEAILRFVNGLTWREVEAKASRALIATARLRWSDEAPLLLALYQPWFAPRAEAKT